MPKRKSSIGRSTPQARIRRAAREEESVEERNDRLDRDRVATAAVRQVETQQHRNDRLHRDRVATAAVRQVETQQHRNDRLHRDRVATAEARETETAMQRVHRQEEDRNRHVHQQRTRADLRNAQWDNAAFQYDPLLDYAYPIGEMSRVCAHCRAKKWESEAPGLCCSNGKIRLPTIEIPPEPLRSLLQENNPRARAFRAKIKLYNSAFQMTSFGTTVKQTRAPGEWASTFRVQGQVYHCIAALEPHTDQLPSFIQIYFMDDLETQARRRGEAVPSLDHEIVLQLQEMLHAKNNLIRGFVTAMEQLPSEEYSVIIRADRVPAGEHSRRYNEPTTHEIAVIVADEQHGKRDVVLKKRDGPVPQFQRISETNRAYDGLQYPLLYWNGCDGYHFGLRQYDNTTAALHPTKKISSMDFYAYMTMVRQDNFNHLIRCKDLFHQFLTDMYAKIESERLLYITLHQKNLRAENYIDLKDAINNDRDPTDTGQRVILPSSFTGGPRYMHQRTQDALCYVRKYGKPDLFITFTCNPKWEEISRELLPTQTASDRHDIIARVFHLKHKKLINLITQCKVFGPVRCWMYSIEWQKRGLPHSHSLIWLQEKLHSDSVDTFISAELPDPVTDPELFEIIKTQMVHGPCGAFNPSSPCMSEGKCTKRFPREFVATTKTDTDGYPLYRRRHPDDGGRTTTLPARLKRAPVQIDNRWIVPYCPLLCKIFKAHLNVEFCSSVKAIKYVCKYINKGSDRAVFLLGQENGDDGRNEVKTYQTGRYISSNEAAWRIFGFPIHERYPPIEHLDIHLENGQRVYYSPENAAQIAQSPARQTKLTAFFQLNAEDDFARTLLYSEVVMYYTWSANKWKRRKIGNAVEAYPGIKSVNTIGRLYTVHPNARECYFLRLLLNTVKGPRSFEELRTIDGTVYPTFRESCHHRGLLEDDNHWDDTLAEAAATNMPVQLRQLFAIMLHTCDLSRPLQLWEKHKESLCDDFRHREQLADAPIFNADPFYNNALIIIEDSVLNMGGNRLETFGLPQPRRQEQNGIVHELFRERNYNVPELTLLIDTNVPRLVIDQREAYDNILNTVEQQLGGIFFLDAPGGTGKTFLLNLLLARVRMDYKIALAVASSGIAATLLQGGRTAHSAFKIPINLMATELPMCGIKRGSNQGQLLKETHLIVWDEATMSHKRALEAVDRTLRDIRGNDTIMGGVTVVLAGDFRQTLPIVPRGTKANELEASIKNSYLWSSIITLNLKTNMRAHLFGDTNSGMFASNLLRLGDGKIPCNEENQISLPFGSISKTSLELASKVFPNMELNFDNKEWLSERAILAPKNDKVSSINCSLLTSMPGNEHTYRSFDTVEEDMAVNYPVEFLNSLVPPGMPPHLLMLKVGAPIILLRNLNPPTLCNGTRLIVERMMPRVIEATVVTGPGNGTKVFIPRIPLIPSDMPFEFKRLQFPISLSFAMSINKAQGQTLKVVGVNLESPCFSHGQLYVGCSRVGTPENLHVHAQDGRTVNVVYPEALQ